MLRAHLSALALSLLALLGTAQGGIISADFTNVATPYQVNLSAYDAYALWGTGTNGSTDANLTGGQEGLISPALYDFSNGNPTAGRGYATPPFWNYLVNGNQVYGSIHHLTDSYSPVGEGFRVYMTPGDSQTNFTAWVRSSGGLGEVRVYSQSNPLDIWMFELGADEYGYVSISAEDALDSVVLSLRTMTGEAGYNGSNVLLGAVTADVVAVPEPAALTLLVAFALTFGLANLAMWVHDRLKRD